MSADGLPVSFFSHDARVFLTADIRHFHFPFAVRF